MDGSAGPGSAGARRFAAAAAGLLALAYFFRPILDDDAWLHFAAGRGILANGRIPRVDEFSFTAPGVPYIDHEWLAQALFEGLRQIGGLLAFRTVLALVAGAAYALYAATALRLGAGALPALTAAVAGLALQWHLARLRPHLLTLLFVGILVFAFLARRSRPGPRGWLLFAALLVLWANSHAAAVIAPGILGLAAASAWLAGDRARLRELAVLSLASVVLLLANPYGIAVYTYAFETQALAPLIPEWKPLADLPGDPLQLAQSSFGSDFRAQVLSVGFVAAATTAFAAWAIAASRRAARAGAAAPLDAALALPAAALAWLPFVANRHDLFLPVPLAFDAAAFTALAAASPRARGALRAAGAAAALAAVVSLAKDATYRIPRYASGGGLLADVWEPSEPVRAVDFVERAGLEGNCVARLAWGGYLLHRLYPRVRVAFDGRITTYGPAVYFDMVDFLRGARTSEVAAKYGFDFAVVPPWLFGLGRPKEDPRFVAPDLAGEWTIVYRDEDAAREGSAVVALRRASPRFESNAARVRALLAGGR